MNDLVERLTPPTGAYGLILVSSYTLHEAATALEAKDKEIEALRGDRIHLREELMLAEARAETAERRAAELEASALAVENAKLKTWIDLHRGDTLSLSNEVDHFREELAEAERKLAEARAALKSMLQEHGDYHYHTCPADNNSGPCDCCAGIVNRAARAVIEKE